MPPSSPPPAPRPRPLVTFTPAVLLVTVGGLIVGLLLFLAVMNAISSGKAGSPVGTNLYVLGSAKSLGPSVDRQGPLLLSDPLGSKRSIYVQHLGGNDWRAFATNAPNASPGCLIEWQPRERSFVDKCSHQAYPADGTGLTSFPTRVDDNGKVLIDLRSPQAPTTTTTAPPETTTVPPETTTAVPPA
ncbi:MAG: hypothetical protein M3137_15820 [Actinomycetota bacterium]|nr:hypothetical protein [Actinomycetota bacterium]